MTTSIIRIHVYFGPVCKSIAFNKSLKYQENVSEVLDSFGISKDNHKKYLLKLQNGGIIEKNEALFHDDRVMILPEKELLSQHLDIKSQDSLFKQENIDIINVNQENTQKSRVKAEDQNAMLLQTINAIHMKDFHQVFKTFRDKEQAQKAMQLKKESKSDRKYKKHKDPNCMNGEPGKHERIQYKTLLKKRFKREGGEDKNQQQIKIEEQFDESIEHKIWTQENIVRKIDYDNLEVLLYKKQVTDYHQLIDLINLWAVNIGFLVKLKRSPKLNADGSQTLRLYCQSYKRSEPLDDQDKTEYQSHPNCKFAMTFKQDEKTGCWLMYQEYIEDLMKHNHKLEKKKYETIREYVQEYHDKVKSLSELKELIYDKFGLEYTLNQITYFKGRWTGEAVVVERESGENECQHLVKLLRKGTDDFLEVEFDNNDKSNLLFMFYSTAKMKDIYLRNNDIVYINKRFSQNRFKRPLIMFFTVSNTGKSQLLGFSLIEKEEVYYFSKIAQCFLKHMNTIQPQTLIIERQLKLYQAFKETLPQSNILFCYFHIQRTFKQQYAFLEKEKPEEFQKIVELPMIENEQAFEQQLSEVNKLNFANEYYKLIIQKLTSEKKLWPKWAHLQFFTAGISVCQRNEQLKTYLKPALKKRECAVSEALKRILTIDQKEFKLSHEYQKVSQKHESVFKVANFLNTVVKDQYSMYAYLRMKWNIARGFRFEVKDENSDYFTLQLKQSNIANKKVWQPAHIKVKKYTNSDGKKMGVCDCGEQNHSGFPCPHLCLLNYKGKVDHLDISHRWRKNKLNNPESLKRHTKGNASVTNASQVNQSEVVTQLNTQKSVMDQSQVKNYSESCELDVNQFLLQPSEKMQEKQNSDLEDEQHSQRSNSKKQNFKASLQDDDDQESDDDLIKVKDQDSKISVQCQPNHSQESDEEQDDEEMEESSQKDQKQNEQESENEDQEMTKEELEEDISDQEQSEDENEGQQKDVHGQNDEQSDADTEEDNQVEYQMVQTKVKSLIMNSNKRTEKAARKFIKKYL